MVMRLPVIEFERELWPAHPDTTFSTKTVSPNGGEPGTTTLDLDLGSGYVHISLSHNPRALTTSISSISHRRKIYRTEPQTVSTFLVLLTTGLQYMVQRLNYAKDLERIERIRQDAKTNAWGNRLVPPEGQKKASVIWTGWYDTALTR